MNLYATMQQCLTNLMDTFLGSSAWHRTPALKQRTLQALPLKLRTSPRLQRKKYPVDLYATVQQYLTNLMDTFVDSRSMALTQETAPSLAFSRTEMCVIRAEEEVPCGPVRHCAAVPDQSDGHLRGLQEHGQLRPARSQRMSCTCM